MSVTADKTKPQSAQVYYLNEIHIVPGTNEITMSAYSDDQEIQPVRGVVDVQAKIDNMDQTDLDAYNNFFRRSFADLIGVDPTAVSGEVFSKSS